jgi:hypothetical protein
MSARRTVLITIAILLCAAAPLSAGCSSSSPAAKTPREPAARPASSPASGAAKSVLMNGRSVGYNWMAHWGYVGDGTVKKNGYVIGYKELDGNDIPGSFTSNVSGLAPGSLAFFKFCFVDFDGSNLAQREKELDAVLATARARGLKLVVGNALPVRKEDGSAGIVAEERKFNAYLDEKAAGDPGVWVYDFNSVLAGQDGYLKPEYDSGDSHPNDAAYDVLDQTFFPLLDRAYAGTH